MWICYPCGIFYCRNKLFLWPDSCCFFFFFKCCPLQLIPLFLFIGGGAAMSMMYLARLALRNPDVWWGCHSWFILLALQSCLSFFQFEMVLYVFICLRYKVFVASFFFCKWRLPASLCSWDRKNNPEPWNKMAPTDQYKVCQSPFIIILTNYAVWQTLTRWNVAVTPESLSVDLCQTCCSAVDYSSSWIN